MKEGESRVADYFVLVSSTDNAKPLAVPTEDPILDVQFCSTNDPNNLPSEGYEPVPNMAGEPCSLKRGVTLFMLRASALDKHNLAWDQGYINDADLVYGDEPLLPGWNALQYTTAGYSADLNRQSGAGKEIFLAVKRAKKNIRQRYHAVRAVTHISIVAKGESIPPSTGRNSYNSKLLEVGAKIIIHCDGDYR